MSSIYGRGVIPIWLHRLRFRLRALLSRQHDAELRRELQLHVDGLAAYSGNAFNLTGQGRPERLDGIQVTPNLFSVIGVEPVLGRAFLPSEGARGTTGFVILSHGLWQRRFGGDVDVVGRAVVLNGQPIAARSLPNIWQSLGCGWWPDAG
jgi:hypothetical protein